MSKKKGWVKPVNPDSIKVIVTAEDIKKGKRINEECCAIALATNRALKDVIGLPVSVTATYVAVTHPEEGYERSTQLPMEAIQFVDNFDKGREVFPMEFEIIVTTLKCGTKKLLPENSLIKNKELPIDKNTET